MDKTDFIIIGILTVVILFALYKGFSERDSTQEECIEVCSKNNYECMGVQNGANICITPEHDIKYFKVKKQ